MPSSATKADTAKSGWQKQLVQPAAAFRRCLVPAVKHQQAVKQVVKNIGYRYRSQPYKGGFSLQQRGKEKIQDLIEPKVHGAAKEKAADLFGNGCHTPGKDKFLLQYKGQQRSRAGADPNSRTGPQAKRHLAQLLDGKSTNRHSV